MILSRARHLVVLGFVACVWFSTGVASAETRIFGYDAPAEVVAAAHEVADASTTLPTNSRSATRAARVGVATAPGVVYDLSSGELAAREVAGGAGPVRVGQAGEDAVRGAYNIGDKTPITVNGRGRIPDGLTPTTLSEVKNVASLSYSRQLRDFVDYAQANGLRVDLYVRGGASPTRLSGPLRDAIRDPSNPIRLRRIP